MHDGYRSREALLKELAELREEVADLKREQEELTWIKAAYNALLENIPENVFVKDTNSVYLDGSAQYAELYDLTLEELPGKTDYDFNPPDQAERFSSSGERIIASGEAEHTEIAYERKGERRWSRSIKAPIKDEEGNVIGILGLFKDITEEKRTENQLHIKDQAIEAMNSGFALFDLDAEVQYANPALAEMLGYDDAAELQNAPIADLCQDPMRAASVIVEVKETGHWRGEVTLQQRDERALIADMSATLLTRDSGEPFRIVATFIDITAQKQTEQELLEHRDRLEEMVQERTRTIREQADEILELSTPTMQVWDGILVAPLIGMLDSQRTQRFMEVLLNAIVDTDSESALIDLTGVPTIDTQTAQFIIETIEAVRLLGADVILTGVRPSIAQTLVHLGIDLSDITTRSSLVAGLRVALNTLGLEVNAHD